MSTVGILSDSAWIRALHAGFPLRFRFTLELWRDQFVDALEARSEWSVILAHEPLSRRYRLSRSWEPNRTFWFASVDSARSAVEAWYASPLTAPSSDGGASFYYDARLEVEALTVHDLEELELWLRGELAPAVRGERGLPGAVARGVRSVFIRIVGLSKKRYEARTQKFRP